MAHPLPGTNRWKNLRDYGYQTTRPLIQGWLRTRSGHRPKGAYCEAETAFVRVRGREISVQSLRTRLAEA